MLDFLKVTDVTSKAFKAAMKIYSDAFPLNEQQPLDIIEQRVSQHLSELYIGEEDEQIVLMALLWPLKNTDFILLDYMATLDSHRGKNMGSFFLQHISELLKSNNKYFLIESENPDFGHNKEERERRVGFYRRNGAKLLKDVRYVLPGMHGLEPTEMVLLMMPQYKDGVIDRNLVCQLITQVYAELYNRHPGDPLLQASLQSLPHPVQLI